MQHPLLGRGDHWQAVGQTLICKEFVRVVVRRHTNATGDEGSGATFDGQSSRNVWLMRARAAGGKGRPVIGTHDPRMVGEANRLAYELNLKKGNYEFAMLYGIDRAQQRRLVRGGHAMRVQLSYGPLWFPWYMRRLAERPANVFFVLKQLIR